MEGLFPAGPDQKVEGGNRLHRNLPPAVPVVRQGVCKELFGNMSFNVLILKLMFIIQSHCMASKDLCFSYFISSTF